jgi:hypothetical protein
MTSATERVIGAEGAAAWLRGHGHVGLTAGAVRQALRRARKARARGKDGPHLFPEPEPVNGRTPGWDVQTLAGWRPVGRGFGGGRPRSRRGPGL